MIAGNQQAKIRLHSNSISRNVQNIPENHSSGNEDNGKRLQQLAAGVFRL